MPKVRNGPVVPPDFVGENNASELASVAKVQPSSQLQQGAKLAKALDADPVAGKQT